MYTFTLSQKRRNDPIIPPRVPLLLPPGGQWSFPVKNKNTAAWLDKGIDAVVWQDFLPL